jgi:uncharacterized membrane-anchored protein
MGAAGRLVIATVLMLLGAPALADTAAHHAADARAEFERMHWRSGTQKLLASHGTFTVPAHGRMVVGSDATRVDELINGTRDGSVEGFAVLPHRSLYMSYADQGFVTVDDWKDVDADALLNDARRRPRRVTTNARSAASRRCTSTAGCRSRPSTPLARAFAG